MTAKKIPADVATLKGLVQEQAIKIAALEKEAADAKQSKEYAASNAKDALARAEKAEAIIREAHDLIDACPAALPRMVKRKGTYDWSDPVEHEQNLIVRMGSWLGATRA